MKTITAYIEQVHAKPYQVRKQVAFGLAGGATALIAVVWFAGSLTTGAFAINGSDFAMSSRADSATTSASGAPAGLAGVAAVLGAPENTSAHIEIIDTTPAPVKKAEATVIPF